MQKYLPGTSLVTRGSSCAIVSQEYEKDIAQNVFLSNIAWRFLDNIAQGFSCAILFQEYQNNIAEKFLQGNVQNCAWFSLNTILRSIKMTLHKIIFCAMLSGVFLTILYRILTYTRLS